MSEMWAYKNGKSLGTVFGDLEFPNITAINEAAPDRMTAIFVFLGDDRTDGIYRLRSAKAELNTRCTGKGYFEQVLKVEFARLEDGQELYELIRSGKMPATIPFNGEQVPPAFRHLRDLTKEAWGIIRREVSARYYQLRQNS